MQALPYTYSGFGEEVEVKKEAEEEGKAILR
jgi:hypothetical protein